MEVFYTGHAKHSLSTQVKSSVIVQTCMGSYSFEKLLLQYYFNNTIVF